MYRFSTQLDGDMGSIENLVVNALKDEGFGVLTEIDVQATFKKKLDIDERPYKILGACNPSFAHKAITAEPDIGLLLPCNVVLREDKPGQITVAFMDPEQVLKLADLENIKDLANEVRSRLLRVRDSLGGTHID